MFNKSNSVASAFLIGSVILTAGKAQAQSRNYFFDDFNPGNGPITASGFFTIANPPDVGVSREVDFDSDLVDWRVELVNTTILDSSIENTSILTQANSRINRVVTAIGETLPYLEGVTVTDTTLDFTTANSLIPRGFRIESNDSLLDDQLLITTAVSTENLPIVDGAVLGDGITTETIILTSDIPPIVSFSVPSGFEGDVPLNALESSQSSASTDSPTLQANAAAVPFEFSPSLGLLMIGSAWGILRVKKVKSNYNQKL